MTRSSPKVFFIRFFSTELWNKGPRLNSSPSHWLISLSLSSWSVSPLCLPHSGQGHLGVRAVGGGGGWGGRGRRLREWRDYPCRDSHNREAAVLHPNDNQLFSGSIFIQIQPLQRQRETSGGGQNQKHVYVLYVHRSYTWSTLTGTLSKFPIPRARLLPVCGIWLHLTFITLLSVWVWLCVSVCVRMCVCWEEWPRSEQRQVLCKSQARTLHTNKGEICNTLTIINHKTTLQCPL